MKAQIVKAPPLKPHMGRVSSAPVKFREEYESCLDAATALAGRVLTVVEADSIYQMLLMKTLTDVRNHIQHTFRQRPTREQANRTIRYVRDQLAYRGDPQSKMLADMLTEVLD